MKKIIIIISFLIFIILGASAQLAIPTTYELDEKIHRTLEIKYSEKGYQLPKLSTKQIAAISIPAEGLKLYDKDKKKVIYFNGTRWENPEIIRLYTSEKAMKLDQKVNKDCLAKVNDIVYLYNGNDWLLETEGGTL